MTHADSLILTLVGGFVLAFVFGMLANRLKLSPLVGYLVAGIVVGPYTAGFVADQELAPQLAEIGVNLNNGFGDVVEKEAALPEKGKGLGLVGLDDEDL